MTIVGSLNYEQNSAQPIRRGDSQKAALFACPSRQTLGSPKGLSSNHGY